MVSFTRGPFIDVVRKTHTHSSGTFLLDITVNPASTETSATESDRTNVGTKLPKTCRVFLWG